MLVVLLLREHVEQFWGQEKHWMEEVVELLIKREPTLQERQEPVLLHVMQLGSVQSMKFNIKVKTNLTITRAISEIEVLAHTTLALTLS